MYLFGRSALSSIKFGQDMSLSFDKSSAIQECIGLNWIAQTRVKPLDTGQAIGSLCYPLLFYRLRWWSDNWIELANFFNCQTFFISFPRHSHCCCFCPLSLVPPQPAEGSNEFLQLLKAHKLELEGNLRELRGKNAELEAEKVKGDKERDNLRTTVEQLQARLGQLSLQVHAFVSSVAELWLLALACCLSSTLSQKEVFTVSTANLKEKSSGKEP